MEENEKIGFFKRVKISIFNLEDYNIFTKEKFSKALKYFFLLILIVVIIWATASTIKVMEQINKLFNYVKTDFPEFSLKDDQLQVDSFVDSYDAEYDARLIVDTSDEISEEKLKEYKNEATGAYSAILLKDKIIYKVTETTEQEFEFSYNNVTSLLGIKELNKKELVDKYMNKDAMFKLKAITWVYAFIVTFMMHIITVFEDILIVAIFGWIAAKISRVSLKFVSSISLAIYSLTLSIILSTIYYIVNTFTGFEIKYFSVMYMVIAYIYMVASIMLMKEELNKTAGEAVTVEGQVIKTEEEKEEDDKKDKKPKDKNKDKNKNDDNKDKDKNDDNEDKDKIDNKDEQEKISKDEEDINKQENNEK